MLEIRNLTAGYGGLPVLKNLSLTVAAGEIVVVLGANGAGKTTLMNTISGLLAPMSGSIAMQGRPIGGLAAEDVVARGISHVPQGRRVFPGLTVRENLIVATTAATRAAAGGFDGALAEVFELFPRLKEREAQLGWSLSGGEQQMLAVGRAIVARPKLILLDEPSLGLAPLIFRSMFDAIAELNRRDGTTILVVEQNAEQALRIGHRAYVMELGEFLAEGTVAEIASDPMVERAYLGG